MKTRFNTFDLVCCLTELQRLVGMRVNQIYDIDNRTYLIRLHRNEEKIVLLLESGNRMHTTAFEWPKNVSPSGFTMKLRKHLKNKRLEHITQLGIDRIVDLQFGTGEAAYHIILELYDRGNIILCDYEYMILNILRPHVHGEEVRFAVREKYPLNAAKVRSGTPSMDQLKEFMKNGRPGDFLRNVLNPLLPYGPSLIEHCLWKYGLQTCKIGGEVDEQEGGKKKKKPRKKDSSQDTRDFNPETDLDNLLNAVNDMDALLYKGMNEASKGFVIQKKETKPSQTGEEEFYFSNLEFHPILYNQCKHQPYKEFETFSLAIDEFFSSMESQRIDLKAFQLEKDALKKLSNVKEDHARRLEALLNVQKLDKQKAELITRNQTLVDSAILAIRSALANQMSWTDIQEYLKLAHKNNDPVASCIRQLKLEINHISLYLTDPFVNLDDSEDSEGEREEDEEKLQSMVIDVDLGLSAFSNATRYYDQKRSAAKKEQKTIEASGKALKSAEKKTQQTLKDVRVQTSISKGRKVYWFEKFYWFISSENYLVIGGRDQQQNELIVKRYMRANDIYVHAEIQGASSVVIKNPSGGVIPPKTLLEAGTMAICYSVAWDAKVVTSAYWVKSEQVSKTAPTGEYLTTGSFMIRGKKNFLPPCHLILGLSFLFKLEESSVERHKGERRVRVFEEDEMGVATTENEQLESIHEDEEIPLEGSDDENPEDVGESSSKPVDEEELSEDVEKLNLEATKSEEIVSKELEEYSEKSDESEDDDDDGPNFPDTHIKIEHDTGKVTMQADPKLERLQSTETADDVEETLIQAAPLKVKKYERKLKPKKGKQKEEVVVEKESNKKDLNQPKRGQKAKLKKIKEKYKDQDEDERRMRMEILKSAGSGKDSRRGKKQEEEENYKKSAARKPEMKIKPIADEDDTPVADDLDMLDSLTGVPLDEDELLFAVPVVAPYQTLQNYKYKVKLTPGTGKRGKASKTAVQIFMKDKSCSQREKDLMKGVKDEILARNIPGKVKISAPQLLKVKK